MTLHDELIGQLEGYLEEFEGATPLPDALRTAVRAQLPTTRQIGRSVAPMRYLTTATRTFWEARYRLVVAVALLAGAIVAVNLLSRSGVGHPTTTPMLTRYVVGPDEVQSLDTHLLTFMVPDGWTDLAGHGVQKNGVSLTVWVSPRGIWVNPCYWRSGQGDLADFADPPFYESNFLLEAFWDWWGRPRPRGFGNWAGAAQPTLPRGTEPTTTQVDSWDARYVEFRAPEDLDLSSCLEGEYRIWVDFDGQVKTISTPGELNRVWLLKLGLPDVREGGFVMIDASSSPGSSSQDLAELEAMVESIRVETLASVPTASPT